jgi:tripartite-type tricarboxylate transporter receptor subunit TctC
MRIERRRFLLSAIGAVAAPAILLCAALMSATSAVGYPTGVVTVVVPYPAGSGSDIFGRLFARQLENQLGQKFIVENRPGANGMNGSATIVRAKADGHTLLFTTNSSHTSIRGLYKNVAYDPVKDFTPVGIVYSGSTLLLARSDIGIETMPQLVAYAKANPGKLNIGHANATGQIAIDVLRRRAEVDVVPVPYRGTPQAIADTLGGNLQLVIADTPTTAQLIEANKLKPLAFFSKERNPAYPQVATYHETIAPGIDLSFWAAIFAPPGAPKDVVDVLANALRKAIEHQEVKDQAARNGLQLGFVGPHEFARKLSEDIVRWTDLIREAGIQPE